MSDLYIKASEVADRTDYTIRWCCQLVGVTYGSPPLFQQWQTVKSKVQEMLVTVQLGNH